MARPSPSLMSVPWTTELAGALEAAASAIARLDARVSASSVASAWALRAAWTGYSKALQLQGEEIDEIDVFSWATGVQLSGRPHRESLHDPFSAFVPWQRSLAATGHHWQEQLPFTPELEDGFAGAPALLRAFEVTRQFALADRSILPWLWLPVLLHRMGVTRSALPSVACGDKALRFGTVQQGPLALRLLRHLAKTADRSLKALEAIEADRRKAISAISGVHRPGELTSLAAGLLHHPVTSPERTAAGLRLTLSGAGKLLDRAAQLGLVQEVSGRRSWRVYVVPDVAVALGLVAAPRGRPRKALEPQGSSKDLNDIVSSFDRDMAEFDARYSFSSSVE
ncbi:hypothetical protein [Sphingomonas panacis]|nr:hypothetical protein [Sphingomonas panacis]